MTDVIKMSDAMLWREEVWHVNNESVLDNINKVYIYNPNYQKWDVMDEAKAWKFKIKCAYTWNEIFIDSFEFGLIDVCKVISWEVTYKDEYWMSLMDWDKAAKDYFYSNEFPVIMKWDNPVWFRKMKWNKESAIYLKKKDLTQILRLPKINWKQNDFSVVKSKQDWTTYRTSEINESHVIYWIFLSWPLEWEYFIFYPKDNLIGFNYSKWAYVQPEEWTLTRIMEDNLQAWNDIRKNNNLWEIKTLPYSLVDLKLSTKQKDVMWKIYNVWTLTFSKFTWTVRDNTSDLEYIKELRNSYFKERFEWFKDPMKVIYLDKTWKEYSDYDKNLQFVDCKFEHDFSYQETKQLNSWVEEVEAEIDDWEVTIEYVNKMLWDNPKAQEVHTAAKKWWAPF